MNSLPWVGKITGCLGADAFIERLGYKKTMYAVSIIQITGVISEYMPAGSLKMLCSDR